MTENEPETIRYTADVFCVRGGHFLAIKRGWAPFEGRWALPGGHVDAGETSRAAAARELLEETGIRVDPASLSLIGVYDQPGRDPRGRYVSVAYAAYVGPLAQPVAGDDAVEVKWIPVEESISLAFDHGQIVEDAQKSWFRNEG